jgi:NAD+ synthase
MNEQKEVYLKNPERAMAINAEQAVHIITAFISKETEKACAKGTVIGLSGGIDSAVVAALCVAAVGKENVHALMMPSSCSPQSDLTDAIELAENLGVSYDIINIHDIEKKYLETELYGGAMCKANLKPRIRMSLLYGIANARHYLVAGTSNKSEMMVGYFTKFGDGGCDMEPIGSLYKTQVYMLAEHLNIPENIAHKVPSAGLWQGQTDEGELGITYKLLDKILLGLELGVGIVHLVTKLDTDVETIDRIIEKVEKSHHKRILPPVPQIAYGGKNA